METINEKKNRQRTLEILLPQRVPVVKVKERRVDRIRGGLVGGVVIRLVKRVSVWETGALRWERRRWRKLGKEGEDLEEMTRRLQEHIHPTGLPGCWSLLHHERQRCEKQRNTLLFPTRMRGQATTHSPMFAGATSVVVPSSSCGSTGC
jgi:hypothetical protein